MDARCIHCISDFELIFIVDEAIYSFDIEKSLMTKKFVFSKDKFDNSTQIIQYVHKYIIVVLRRA